MSVSPPVKQVVSRRDPRQAPAVLAVFELHGDQVRCEFKDGAFQRDVEARGIMASDGQGFVRPGDGVRFWQALDTAFAHLSYLHIVSPP